MERRAYKPAGKSRLNPFTRVSSGGTGNLVQNEWAGISKPMRSDQVRGVDLLKGDITVACKPSSISACSSTADVFARNARAAEVRRVGAFIRMLGVPANLPHEVHEVEVFLKRFESAYPAFTRGHR